MLGRRSVDLASAGARGAGRQIIEHGPEHGPERRPEHGPGRAWDVGPAGEAWQLLGEAQRLTGRTIGELAIRLQTEPAVLDALARGRLDALPPWHETSRVVEALLWPLRIDPRPVQLALAHALAAHHQARAAASAPAVQPATSHRRQRPATTPAPRASGGVTRAFFDVGRRARSVGRRAIAVLPSRPRRRTAINLAIAAVAAASTLATVATAGRSSMPSLPDPVARAMAGFGDFLRLHLAPTREGFRWIEVDDPRSRRGDKLQITRR